jgi:hypothetical protein
MRDPAQDGDLLLWYSAVNSLRWIFLITKLYKFEITGKRDTDNVAI